MFELPENWQELPDDELAELVRAANAAFDEIRQGALNDEALAELDRLADAIEQMSTEQAQREEANAENVQRAEEIEARIRPAAETDPSELEPDGEGEDDGNTEGEGTEQETPAEEPQAVAAAAAPRLPARAKKPTLNQVGRFTPKLSLKDSPITITAAADVPGVPMGRRYVDKLQLADAFHTRARTLPVAHGNGQYVPVASINKPYGDRPSIPPDNPEAALRAWKEAANPDILTAAGGWCAPSETFYGLFGIECVSNLLDLPTVSIERGGIRFPVSPTLADAIASPPQWHWTEADDIAAVGGTPTKPCFRIPCPTFEEVRLACDGICLTHGNLTNIAYPELTERWIDLAMAAHEKFMNSQRIAAMVAGSTPIVYAGQPSASSGVMGAVSLAAHSYRNQHGMCCDDVLELVAPCWLTDMMKVDIARRNGCCVGDVTEAMIGGMFDDIGVRLQYVSDWQGLPVNAVAWPTTVQLLLYPAGTWVLGTGPTINLGVVRDSTLNETNDYTALWMEECWLLFSPGFESKVLTIDVCADGVTGAQDGFACSY